MVVVKVKVYDPMACLRIGMRGGEMGPGRGKPSWL